jgi:hypothetical protein
MTTQSKIQIRYCPSRRLRVRRVDELALARETIEEARTTCRPSYNVAHGGGVSNSYGYRAETECCVAIATPDGRAAVWVDRIPANKVTYSGAVYAGPRYLGQLLQPQYDDRYAQSTADIARHFARRAIVAELDSAE